MRIKSHGIGPFDASHQRLALLGQHEKPAIGGIHMEPASFALREVRERLEIIHRTRVRRPGIPNEQEWREASLSIRRDGLYEKICPYAESFIRRHGWKAASRSIQGP